VEEIVEAVVLVHNDLAALLRVQHWFWEGIIGDTERLPWAGAADCANTSLAVVVSRIACWRRSREGGGLGLNTLLNLAERASLSQQQLDGGPY
jgi:hypothetical protein